MNEYTADSQHLEKHGDVLGLIRGAVEGNVPASNAITSFWNFSQAFDDLLDESTIGPEKKREAVAALHDFVVDLLVNPFVLANARELRVLFVAAILRLLAAEHMSNTERANVVRCGDVDVIYTMAYLAGGFESVEKLGPRAYDKEQ